MGSILDVVVIIASKMVDIRSNKNIFLLIQAKLYIESICECYINVGFLAIRKLMIYSMQPRPWLAKRVFPSMHITQLLHKYW